MDDEIIKESADNNCWYKIYKSGKVVSGIKTRYTGNPLTFNLPFKFTNTEYTINSINIPQYNPMQHYSDKSAVCYNSHWVINETEGLVPERKVNKKVYSQSVVVGFNESNICPINKTAYTQGTSIPKTVSFKGPTKTANVENISSDPSVGVSTGTLNEIRLSLATNQFITLKVDISGAKINNLPAGFTFANSEITGAAKNPGEYRFNIVSEAMTVPVIMKVSNIIRIS